MALCLPLCLGTAVLGMLVGGFTFGLIVGSLGEMARKNNPGEAYRSKKIGHISAFLAGRQVSADLMRRVRMYFSNHYQLCSIFGTNALPEYFLRLPVGLRNELASSVRYLGSSRGPSMLAEVKCFHSMDDLSVIMVCAHMKTITFDKSVVHHHSIGENEDAVEREFVFKNGERAFEMFVVLEGRLL